MADDKKIIVDEDWKAQVAAEKARSEKEPEVQSAEAAPAEDFQMPPASWELLLTTLATEAMIGMGMIPHPATGQPVRHPNQAKYLIDTIEMLRDKSKGNLSPGESQLTEQMLHQLRMAYIDLNNASGKSAAS